MALSFRLAPEFLPEVEYPKKPYGMFIVIGGIFSLTDSYEANTEHSSVGNEFRGFHIRFHDVARGGIRIVLSRNKDNYSVNQRMLSVF